MGVSAKPYSFIKLYSKRTFFFIVLQTLISSFQISPTLKGVFFTFYPKIQIFNFLSHTILAAKQTIFYYTNLCFSNKNSNFLLNLSTKGGLS